MRQGRVKAIFRRLAVLACAGALAGCATGATTGAFVPADRIEKELHRGVSTKTDVQRVLGTPKGYGAMAFPQDRRKLEVWYYEDIEVTNVRRAGEGLIRADVRQQILLVTFDKSTLDGFIWFTNAGQTRER
jgi:outer membrane protein assembly factor BamE (lipoprotein component of BamABCDE complex)